MNAPSARPLRSWLAGVLLAAMGGTHPTAPHARAAAPDAALAATTPALQHVEVYRSGTDGYHTFRIPALIDTGPGALLAFAEGRRGGQGDAGDIDTVLRSSADGGATWGPMRVIWDDGDHTCGNPCPVLDRETGVLWLLQTWNRGDDPESRIIAGTSHDTRRVFVRSSSDRGRTWTDPREITSDVKRTNWTWYATGPGAGIQLSRGPHRGRLVVPCDHIESGTRRYFSHVILSDDHGSSWRLGGRTPRDQVNECEVAELADGRLRLNMRSYDPARKARQTAISRDGGSTWESQEPVPELVDPICQASLRRWTWPEGDRPGVLLFANAASTNRRERLTVRASLDDGRTWPLAWLIDAGPSAYSCLATLGGSGVGLLREAAVTRLYDRIVFTRLAPAWDGTNLVMTPTAPP